MLQSSPPAINSDREQSLTPTRLNVAHPLSEQIAHFPALHPQQGSGEFVPNTFEGAVEGAGTYVRPHPHELDGTSRASRLTTVSTARLQIQGSSNQQTCSYQYGQSLQYPPHIAYHVTYDQGLLLPGIECGVADPMLQARLRWHANIQRQAMFKHSPHLRLSRGRSTFYRRSIQGYTFLERRIE